MIKHEDLKKFKGQYPYGSELFGVYQTLLGWRGVRARSWFLRGFALERSQLSDRVLRHISADVEARPNADNVLTEIGRIGIGKANNHIMYLPPHQSYRSNVRRAHHKPFLYCYARAPGALRGHQLARRQGRQGDSPHRTEPARSQGRGHRRIQRAMEGR